ncbi:enoyl-CoA hydratase/isomerase family protein [Sphingomonas profundi]|uniref:enoyl-CoA hydratase/isomerase family protein n=1 Tax=Alterirhizorhabdus profundi TaxID=2681549 RepID=UPI0012E8F43A|nr:enoyl-CoA hydratase-related protein [Sphingomonas profundi]
MTSPDQPAPPVRLAIADGVATLTLARPEAGNAMDWALLDAFAAGAERVAADPSVRAILIEAEGRNFSVGGDIRSFAGDADPAAFIGRLARRLHDGIRHLVAHPAPVIVAAQGAAAGAGLSLVASGDVVLAGAGATFTLAYPAIGLTADGGATWLLPRVIGLRRTQELAFTGRRLNAAEAAGYGLVTRVVDDAALADEARALAARIARGPTAAYGAIKRLLAGADRATLSDHLDAEAETIERAMATHDAQQGIRAFLDRRAPDFAGR